MNDLEAKIADILDNKSLLGKPMSKWLAEKIMKLLKEEKIIE